MQKEVLLFAEEFVSDNRPLFNSAQGQVFVGSCPVSGEKRVIKQINLANNPKALVKELQVFKLFVAKLGEPEGQDIDPLNPDLSNNNSAEVGDIEEIIKYPDLFRMIKGVPKILGLKYT